MADLLTTLNALRQFVDDMNAARQAIRNWRQTVQQATAAQQAQRPANAPAGGGQQPGQGPQLSGWQQLLRAFGITGPRAGAPPAPPPAGGAGGGAAGGGAAAAGGMAVRAAGMAGAVYMFSKAVADTVIKLQDFAMETAESTERFRAFNGAINQQWALMERQNLELQFRTADATAGTTQKLLEETRKMREAMQPLREFGINLRNTLATGAAQLVQGAVKVGEGLIEANTYLRFIKDLMKEAMAAQALKERQPYNEWLRKAIDGEYWRPRNGGDRR